MPAALRLLYLALLCLLALPALAQSGQRVALLVGNAAYADAPLKNPANDARDLADKLRGLGFEVNLLTDRNRSQLTSAIRDFGRTAVGAEAALFYFAGHGVQVRGRNYLLPVGQKFSDEAEVETDAVDVGSVLARLEEAGAKVSLLVLDACRSNPLQRRGRGSVRGLARMEAPSGALVAFAAQPGAEAQDGDGRNGVFTKNLLKHIATPGLPVEQLFKRVRADVEQETGRRQSPREESSLTADFSFSTNPFAPVTPANRDRIEDEAWGLCKAAATVLPCEDYLSGWPQGRYMALVKTRIRELRAIQEAAAKPPAAPAPALPAGTVSRRAGEVFRDCSDCPEMVVVGGGTFTMGSPEGEQDRRANEGPQRRVTVARDFALGRYEVTVGEFRRFVQAKGYVTDAERDVGAKGCYAWDASDGKAAWRAGRSWRAPGWDQKEREPVVCVSWNDAQAYVKWLVETTGKAYRLPSEAEWEYAARAGSLASRPWVDEPDQACKYANVADQTKGPGGQSWNTKHECSDGYWYTAPAGSFEANRWGLYDMIGNASEWVQDCYDEKAYEGKAPTDGRPSEVAGCSRRVLRGGSWGGSPQDARSAFRDRDSPDVRINLIGFRLASKLGDELVREAQPATPMPQPSAPTVAAKPTMEKVTLAADVYFYFQATKLLPEAEAKLLQLADRARGMTLEVIIAMGHATPEEGNPSQTQKLSIDRAEAVKAFLVSSGVNKNRVYTEGKGASQPAAANGTAEGRAKNRRVEVEVVGVRAKN